MMSPPLFVVVRRVVRPGGDGGFDDGFVPVPFSKSEAFAPA